MLESNQFDLKPTKGALTLFPNVNVIDCQLADDQAGVLLAGDPLVIEDVAGDVIKVKKASAASDKIFGCLAYSVKRNEYAAKDFVRVATDYCAMVCEASAAIAAGADVEIDPATSKVETASSGSVLGMALNKAGADGDLIPVLFKIVAA